MILHLSVLDNSIFSCNIRVTDANGARFYHVPQTDSFGTTPQFLDVEINGSECDVAIAPIETNPENLWKDTPSKNLFDKVASKCGKKLVSYISKIVLHVTCEYHLTDLKDGDCIDIIAKQYVYNGWDEFVPMAYAFYEIEYNSKRATVKKAFGTNRRDVIKTSRPLAFGASAGYGLLLIFYPIQMIRIRYLLGRRKVLRAIKKFNKMTPEERKKFEEQMDKKF